MKRIVALTLVATLILLSGCQCISGLGRDMQKAGEWVEEKANGEK